MISKYNTLVKIMNESERKRHWELDYLQYQTDLVSWYLGFKKDGELDMDRLSLSHDGNNMRIVLNTSLGHEDDFDYTQCDALCESSLEVEAGMEESTIVDGVEYKGRQYLIIYTDNKKSKVRVMADDYVPKKELVAEIAYQEAKSGAVEIEAARLASRSPEQEEIDRLNERILILEQKLKDEIIRHKNTIDGIKNGVIVAAPAPTHCTCNKTAAPRPRKSNPKILERIENIKICLREGKVKAKAIYEHFTTQLSITINKTQISLCLASLAKQGIIARVKHGEYGLLAT